MLLLFLSALLVLVDQIVKWWTIENLALGEHMTFIPGLVSLTYVQNTGAAFSMLAGNTLLLGIVSLLSSLLLLYLLWRDYFPHPLARFALALVLGGAVGNLIDRFLLGFVVDMFHLEFMQFAVFNVADIGVSVGGAILLVYLAFLYREETKA